MAIFGPAIAPVAKAGSGLLGSVLGGLGSVVGGLFGAKGQRDANQANAREAAKNRAFQERMSNTAYQRAAQDLERAGLNRILAIGQPSSTPGGAQARFENDQKQLGEATSGAALMAANIRRINAETAFTRAKERALTPASELGGAAGGALNRLFNMDGDIDEQFKNLFNKVTAPAREAGKNINKNVSLGARGLADRLGDAAASVSVKEQTARRELLKIAKGMDHPSGLTEDQLLRWAMRNQDKVQRYIERNNLGKPKQ